jgi:Protein of unknown function (DUF2948)
MSGDGRLLRLRAEDDEDIAVFSAVLQDALVPVADIAFFPDEQRFLLVANRFRWERDARDERKDFERIHTGFRADAVTAVKYRGFRRSDPDRLLELLTITSQSGAITLEFAGDASVRLEVDRILCHLEDIGEPWPTRWRPDHPVDRA